MESATGAAAAFVISTLTCVSFIRSLTSAPKYELSDHVMQWCVCRSVYPPPSPQGTKWSGISPFTRMARVSITPIFVYVFSIMLQKCILMPLGSILEPTWAQHGLRNQPKINQTSIIEAIE
eukprot:5726347-Karenia_brevis.AAC.1